MPLIAHQGGWDEILLVAGPMLVVVGVLTLVKRRVEAAAQAAAEAERDAEDETRGDLPSEPAD
ncbi:MAG: hypothetical protein ACO20T_07450 [Ilumatobacteraceae bacterium]